MNIDWNFDADLRKIVFKYDEKREHRIVTPTVVLRVDETLARERLGERFAQIVFGPLEGGRFGYKTLKPALVVEKHAVVLNDHGPLGTMPEIDKVEPVNGVQVDVYLKLPFVLEDRGVITALVENFGEGIRVEMRPSQMPLPGMDDEEKEELN